MAMASRDHSHAQSHAKKLPLLTFISLLCFISVFLALSLLRNTSLPSSSTSPSPHAIRFRGEEEKSSAFSGASCNFSDGAWIYAPSARSAVRYDHTCKEIFKGWNCVAGGKSNGLDLLDWRWKPRKCDLSPFDPASFLRAHRDTSIGFIGDSLNRNMFVSLFCSLRAVSDEVKKWRPVGADRGFTFLRYNLTVAYHRTNLLARYGRWLANTNGGALESLGYKEGYRVDVDIPDVTWVNSLGFHDILIFNTGHWWWAPSKFDPVRSPMLFFEKGQPITPTLSPDQGLDMVLKHMIEYVRKSSRRGAIKFFRTQSPRHFEGGDWDKGGTCSREEPLSPEQVKELFSVKNNGTNVETRLVNQHLFKALEGSDFHILNVTELSEFRADAHPSSAGGKKHDDCMHWCLPGLTDTWNDLFVNLLNKIKHRI